VSQSTRSSTSLAGVACLSHSRHRWAKPVRFRPGAFKRTNLGSLLVSLAGVTANALLVLHRAPGADDDYGALGGEHQDIGCTVRRGHFPRIAVSSKLGKAEYNICSDLYYSRHDRIHSHFIRGEPMKAHKTIRVATFTGGLVGPSLPMLGPLADGGTIRAKTAPGCWGPMITPSFREAMK